MRLWGRTDSREEGFSLTSRLFPERSSLLCSWVLLPRVLHLVRAWQRAP